MSDEKVSFLIIRDDLIDVIDDVSDFVPDSVNMKNSILKRLSNALDYVNELIDKLGIGRDYIPNE